MKRIALAALAAMTTAMTAASTSVAQERPKAFVDAASVVPGLVVEMRYLGANNFVGRRIDGYEGARCLLTRQAATALAEAQRDLGARGFGLKVFDCYRPARAVAHFMRWARDLADVANKQQYYPEVDKRDLFKKGYIAARSGHSRGSTIDLTLVRRSDTGELDMGTGFDLFSPRSWPSSRAVTPAQRANRMMLAAAMARAGFSPLAREWWHFTLRNEPFPNRYFDFVVR